MGMDNATYLFQTYILLWDPQSNNYQNCPLIKVFLFIWAWSPSRTCWDTIGIFKGLNPWKYKKREPKKDWRSISLNRNINLWVNQKRKWSLSYCFDPWSLINLGYYLIISSCTMHTRARENASMLASIYILEFLIWTHHTLQNFVIRNVLYTDPWPTDILLNDMGSNLYSDMTVLAQQFLNLPNFNSQQQFDIICSIATPLSVCFWHLYKRPLMEICQRVNLRLKITNLLNVDEYLLNVSENKRYMRNIYVNISENTLYMRNIYVNISENTLYMRNIWKYLKISWSCHI